jgi:ribosomal protein L11 methyltransferase
MKWSQVDVKGPESLEEIAIACLSAAGCSGVQVIRQEDLPEFDYVDQGLSGPVPVDKSADSLDQEDIIVRGYLPEGQDPTAELWSALELYGLDDLPRPPALIVTILEDPGWSRSWRRYFRAARVGQRLVVAPSWSRRKPHRDEVLIWLDPGMAFGTGQHATTRLCLRAMERWVRPGARVLDVGCGSGILGIAASLLGSGPVMAFDVDCVAVATSRENCRLNHIEQQVMVQQGTLMPPYPPADIVVANILAPTIINLAPAAAACLRQGAEPGVFIASGIVQSQVGAVRDALADAGLTCVEDTSIDDWACMVACAG